ncbi:MAG: hypothetical protein H7224_08965 [Polaromonas sp.]|nr:hypothetical protein [Polaromonas sp.]
MTSTPIPSAPTAPPLALDKRQRAMLKEMGIRVWSPLDALAPTVAIPVSEVHVAIESVATEDVAMTARASFHIEAPTQSAPSLPTVPTSAFDQAPGGASWQFDAAHALFSQMPPQPGPLWLVLAEASSEPATALATADPLDGDAGQLLANMLRAARLAHSGRVVLVPLRRLSSVSVDTRSPSVLAEPATSQLTALIAVHQPDLVLVMGRLAAQALLETTEPLGKLRGRVHTLQGVPTVVTYDAQPLLRTPSDKAKAWDDLCLAMATAAAAPGAVHSGG